MDFCYLAAAIDRADFDTIQRIISSRSINLNKISSNGHTPLSYALKGTSERVVRLLLNAGADPNFRMPDGSTILHRAVKYGKWVQLLIDSNADVHAECNSGKTPLRIALGKEDILSIIALYRAGAHFNIELLPSIELRNIANRDYGLKIMIIKKLIRDGGLSDADLKLYPGLHCVLLIQDAEHERKIKQELLEHIASLNEKIEEMKAAPPEDGGEYFRAARSSFMNLSLK